MTHGDESAWNLLFALCFVMLIGDKGGGLGGIGRVRTHIIIAYI